MCRCTKSDKEKLCVCVYRSDFSVCGCFCVVYNTLMNSVPGNVLRLMKSTFVRLSPERLTAIIQLTC